MKWLQSLEQRYQSRLVVTSKRRCACMKIYWVMLTITAWWWSSVAVRFLADGKTHVSELCRQKPYWYPENMVFNQHFCDALLPLVCIRLFAMVRHGIWRLFPEQTVEPQQWRRNYASHYSGIYFTSHYQSYSRTALQLCNLCPLNTWKMFPWLAWTIREKIPTTWDMCVSLTDGPGKYVSWLMSSRWHLGMAHNNAGKETLKKRI